MGIRVLTRQGKITDGAEARRWVESRRPAGSRPAPACPPFWLDVIEPDAEAIQWLAGFFHFHPLTIEDLLSTNERGKLETYENYLFLIGHSVHVEAPPAPSTGRAPARPLPTNPICPVESHEIHAYLSQQFLVTVHDADMQCVEKVWDYVAMQPGEDDAHPLDHGPDFVLYRLLDSTVDTYFATLQATADQIDWLEDVVVDRPERHLLDDVFIVKRNLVTIRRLAGPMREAMNGLSNAGNAFVGPANQVYLRDVHNLLVAVTEVADTQRDSSSGVLDAYLSSVNNNLSQVMKRLTAIATIFLPLSFLVGFGGMNFTAFMPFDNPVAFWGMIALLVAIPVGMFIWFLRNDWL